MSGFISDESIRNQEADEPWKKSDTDKMLDLYFGGAHPSRISVILKRNPESIRMRLKKITHNEFDRAIKYHPFRRVSRKGKRFTESERNMIRSHKEKGVPAEATARVLMRNASEFDDSFKQTAGVKDCKVFAVTLDLILALRYVYHVYHRTLIPKKDYEELVKEEIEYGGAAAFAAEGDPRPCLQRIKTLALYLCEKFDDEKGGK